mmetsp:Transcript_1050/g.3747  ORF Transcript_1050/g.3747 Transcript_1050/m.3747 type:complete len:218 (-) Transcript_1050:644-1297(-)
MRLPPPPLLQRWMTTGRRRAERLGTRKRRVSRTECHHGGVLTLFLLLPKERKAGRTARVLSFAPSWRSRRAATKTPARRRPRRRPRRGWRGRRRRHPQRQRRRRSRRGAERGRRRRQRRRRRRATRRQRLWESASNGSRTACATLTPSRPRLAPRARVSSPWPRLSRARTTTSRSASRSSSATSPTSSTLTASSRRCAGRRRARSSGKTAASSARAR